ncbi:hypothetical protein [Variovorax sp. IB41]|uniref:hypothetical protein n=1 Tax=Variovorax sp. IB41 TaxID=2779370 RepID=UPI0018E7D0CB|nr:hypothetical protein [Variovorax sp. IB41]MBJ2155779.1 hypothetical protein [Variovorax sp. IB41]
MGSYAELYFTDAGIKPAQGELSDDAPYLLSGHHLPLLWLSLFQREDIIDLPDPDEPDSPWPYLVAPRTQAMATLAARRALLSTRFPGLKPLWFDQFAAMLAQAPFAFVHLDTMEIGSMIATGPEWRRILERLLGVFDTDAARAEAGWRQFDAGFIGPYQGKDADKPWTYCGSGGAGSPMPWDPPE